MAPILQEIEDQNYDISVFIIDTDTLDELCLQVFIPEIPTILYYKNGELINKTVGLQNKDKILSIFNK
jgi:thioredoxin 1